MRQLPGVTVYSNPDRDHELQMAESRDVGDCEGFRRDEFAQLFLQEPVPFEEEMGHIISTITQWPVKIIDIEIKVDVDRKGVKSRGKGLDLEGGVSQRCSDDVSLLGTDEILRVDESRLIPGLLAGIPHSAESVGPGKRSEHTWLGRATLQLCLENGKPRAHFRHILAVLMIQMQTMARLRTATH